ncbi:MULTISPECIES: hypothetical protein [Actinomadura]|uniref:Uncharacterized protein n=1 Tax=Actinomadura litoris TaxID=2678616 RepID=A0A7K1KUY9_9ACTN|nr:MULTISPECIES: hypothetical protein [Actinomadura]MBT2211059.1 hypothetical protein [Actinomadura sp. NEAU-AAG7]MUN35980.1 hypothetical protein [Actinomadura litoris]
MKNSVRLLMTVGACAAIAGGALAVSGASADTGSAPRPAAGRVAATTLFAKVGANGALLASSGIGNVNHFGGGRYNLTTSIDISGCALLGTINTGGGNDPGPGSSSILVGAVNGRTLFVRTATPSASGNKIVDDDRPFSVQVTC